MMKLILEMRLKTLDNPNVIVFTFVERTICLH